MNFGTWLHQFRVHKVHLDLRSASDLTGVDPSTINRIENGRTQPTLDTVIRICEGLGIELTELVNDLVGLHQIPTPLQLDLSSDEIIDTLTEADVNAFVDRFNHYPAEYCQRLAEAINEVVETEVRDSGETLPPRVEPSDIAKFLSESSVYTMRFEYPSELSPNTIMKLYKNGGVLTFNDVGLYLKGVRRLRKRTLAQLERTTQRSASVISRLEGGNLERIKFSDILALNSDISEHNEILGMFWVAAKVHSNYHGMMAIHEHHVAAYDLVVLFISLSRWLMLGNPASTNWLNKFRNVFT